MSVIVVECKVDILFDIFPYVSKNVILSQGQFRARLTCRLSELGIGLAADYSSAGRSAAFCSADGS